MTEQAHTPGPRYTVVELPGQDDLYSWAISETGVGLVPGLTPGRPQRFDSKGAAEARIKQMIGDRLRDAAPEMLAALKAADAFLTERGVIGEMPAVIRAAIAKAEGQHHDR